jgi:hypothetical protein
MLSQGRAAEKEVELGMIRRENEMLKKRVQGMWKVKAFVIANQQNSSSCWELKILLRLKR